MDAPWWFVLRIALDSYSPYWLLKYQNGSKWAVGHVLLIAPRVSPQNCELFFRFLILTVEWRGSKCIRPSLSRHCWRKIQRTLVKFFLPFDVQYFYLTIIRETWFTQDHINQLVAAGINTVRIPVSNISTLLLTQSDLLMHYFSSDIGLLSLW